MADEGVMVELGANVDSLLGGVGAAVRALEACAAAAVGLGAVTATVFVNDSIERALSYSNAMETLERRASFSRVAIADLRSALADLDQTSVGALFSLGETAAALTTISTRGKSTADQVDILRAAQNVAAGSQGAISLADALRVVNDILEAYGLGAEDAAMVSDVLIATWDATGKPIDEIGQGLVNASRFSKTFGWDLSQTAATLVTLKDQGIDSLSKLGSALANVSGQLALPLGISVTDPNTGEPRNPGDIISDVVAKLSAMSADDRTALIRVALAPDGQLTPEAFLQASLLDTYLGRLGDIEQKYRDIAGAAGIAETAANQFADSPAGKLQARKADFDALKESVGDKLLPVLLGVLTVVNGLLVVIEKLSPIILGVAAAFVAYSVAAAIAGASTWLVNAGWAVMLGLVIALEFALTPLGLAVIALGAIVALFAVAWQKDWFGVREIVANVVDRVVDAWAWLTSKAETLAEEMSGLVAFVSLVFGVLLDTATFIFGSLAQVIGTWARIVWAIVEPFLATLLFAVAGTFGIIWATISAVFDTIVAFIVAVLLTLKAIFTGDLDAISGIWSAFGDRLGAIWTRALDFIVGAFNLFGGWAAEAFTALPGRIVDALGDLGAYLWQHFTGWLHSVAERLTSWASGVLGLSPTLTEIGAMIPGAIVRGLAGAGAAIWNGLRGALSWVDEQLSSWAAGIASRAQAALDAARNGAANIAGAVSNAINGTTQVVTGSSAYAPGQFETVPIVTAIAAPAPAPNPGISPPMTSEATLRVVVEARDDLFERIETRLSRDARSRGWMG